MSASIKAKIEKLLQMTTERGATEAEAAVALEKAQKLLAEHNLTEDDVLGAAERKDHKEEEHYLAFAWAKKVARSIAELYDCVYLEHRGSKHHHFKATFVGRQSNAETARLITQFVVKTILLVSRRAQSAAKAPNRFATDFQHGAAERVARTAAQLWREANREQIEAKERQRKQEQEEYRAMRPNLEDPLPGTWRVWVLDAKYAVKKELILEAAKMADLVRTTVTTKPRGTYWIVVNCIDGVLKSKHEYWWEVNRTQVQHSRGRVRVQDHEAYAMGDEAGKNIGLHVQVGEVPTQKLEE